eukprot:m.50594 g.50594  ORF g.50594 m.50594 type:complete len:424 (+) comp21315_c0_seq4:184-1455(+)
MDFSMETRDSTRCKYLGRMVLDGPLGARPNQRLLGTMITHIEKQAPLKKKKKVTFICDRIKPAVPDRRKSSKQQNIETFVALNDDDDSEFCRIPVSSIVSIAASKKIFVFVMLDHKIVAPSATCSSSAEVNSDELGRFYVFAFRCQNFDQARQVSEALILRVENNRDQDFHRQHHDPNMVIKHSQQQTFTSPGNDFSTVIEQDEGRKSVMSPLPEHVQNDTDVDLTQHKLHQVLQHQKYQRHQLLHSITPRYLSPQQHQDRIRLQDAINDHDLSPRDTEARVTVPATRRRTALRPPRKRAVALQQQYGRAIKLASIDVHFFDPQEPNVQNVRSEQPFQSLTATKFTEVEIDDNDVVSPRSRQLERAFQSLVVSEGANTSISKNGSENYGVMPASFAGSMKTISSLKPTMEGHTKRQLNIDNIE